MILYLPHMNWLAKGVSDYGDSVSNAKNVITPLQSSSPKHPRGGGLSSLEGPHKKLFFFIVPFIIANLHQHDHVACVDTHLKASW